MAAPVAPILAQFLLGTAAGVLENKNKKAKETKKATETKVKDPIKVEKEKVKSQKSYIKNLVTNFSTDDNSSLKTHWKLWETALDENLTFLDTNPSQYDRELVNKINLELQNLYKDSGSDWNIAGTKPDSESFYNVHIKKADLTEHSKAKDDFNNLNENEQTEVLKWVNNVQQYIKEDIYTDYNTYVKAIREQFQIEDNIIKNNPAISTKLANLKRTLQDYHAAFEWSSYVEKNPDMAGLKIMKREGFGLSPIFSLNEKSMAEYINLQNQYSMLIKEYTGFDVAWMPMPVEFSEITKEDGSINYFEAKNSSNPEVVLFNARQMKDRNEIIEFAAANRVSAELQNITGMDANTFAHGLDSILNDPELRNDYSPSFINKMEDVSLSLNRIVDQFNIDPKSLTYKKFKFLTDTPDNPDAYMDLPAEFTDDIPEDTLNVEPIGKVEGGNVKSNIELYGPTGK